MLEINPADLSAIGELYVPLEHVCDGFQEQWDNCPGLHASFANTSWSDASTLSSAGRVLWRSRGMWSLRAFTSESRALAPAAALFVHAREGGCRGCLNLTFFRPRDCTMGAWTQWQLQGGCTGLQLRHREVEVHGKAAAQGQEQSLVHSCSGDSEPLW